MLPDRVLTPRYPGLVYPNLVRGLVGAWSPCLTPERGTRLRDATGRKNHGTLTNMDPATDWVVSEGKWALDYDGLDDGVPTLYTGALADFTVCAWFYSRATTAFLRIVDKTYDTGFWIGHSETWGSSDYGGGILESVSPYGHFLTFTENAWHHLAMSRKGTTKTIYGNGGQSVTSATVLSTVTSTNPLRIGSRTIIGDNNFNGLIDGCLLFNRALSANEVAQLYSLGRGGWATRRKLQRPIQEIVQYTPSAEFMQHPTPYRDRYVPVPY